MSSVTIPRDCYVWFGEDCIADGGNIIPHTDMDVKYINLAVDLRGSISGKTFTLEMIDVTEPTRILSSTQTLDVKDGNYVGYMTFEFEKFHVQATDTYQVRLCVNDDTGLTFGMIADWQDENGNYANTHTKTQQIPGPRVLMYGVDSGLYAC